MAIKSAIYDADFNDDLFDFFVLKMMYPFGKLDINIIALLVRKLPMWWMVNTSDIKICAEFTEQINQVFCN